MRKITINYNFTSGDELSYKEVKDCPNGYNIKTNCLQFFNLHSGDDVTILRKDGRYINNLELLKNTGVYTDKEIRSQHNILKMFIAGAFNWRQKWQQP